MNIKKLLAASAVGALLTLGLSAPAQAVGVCSANAICFYDTSSSWYPMVDHDNADTYPGECLELGGYSNRTSTIWNRTPSQYWVWTGVGCAGTRGLIYANGNPGNMNSTFNDKIDSYMRIY